MLIFIVLNTQASFSFAYFKMFILIVFECVFSKYPHLPAKTKTENVLFLSLTSVEKFEETAMIF